MRAIVCGGRSYRDAEWLFERLDALHATHRFTLIIVGGAKGADSLAERWALEREVPVVRVTAEWEKHGSQAGPLRNVRMLGHLPDVTIAFPGGVGTEDMCRKTKQVNKPVWRIEARPRAEGRRGVRV